MIQSPFQREVRWRLFAVVIVAVGILAITVAPSLGHADLPAAVPVETLDHPEVEFTPDAAPSEALEELPTATAESVESLHYSEVSDVSVEGTPRAPPATETVDLPDPTPSSVDEESLESSSDDDSSPVADVPVSFDPLLVCTPVLNIAGSIPGSTDWASQSCELIWHPDVVAILDVSLEHEPAIGWEFIVLPDDSTDERLLNASITIDGPSSLSIQVDSTNPEFLIGARAGCSSAAVAEALLTVSLERDGEIESRILSVAFSRQPVPTPDIAVISAEFAAVESGNGATSTVGTIVLDYSSPAAACGWGFELTATSFDSVDASISNASLSFISIAEIPGVKAQSESGRLHIAIPAGPDAARQGHVTILVALSVPESTPAGVYRGTITVTPAGTGQDP